MIVIGVLLAIGIAAGGAGSDPNVPNAHIRVEGRQSLWSLARKHPVDGLSTEQTAQLIAKLNGLKGERLAAGASILVPVQKSPGDAVALAMR